MSLKPKFIKYVTSAALGEQLPEPTHDEIIMIGRSNCGKSSLINTISESNKIARTSKRPGATQMANFFNFGDQFTLVDLPGYGFSKASKAIQKNWQSLAEACFFRPSVKVALCLNDSRREPNDMDFELWHLLDRNAKLIFVLTKADKLKQNELRLIKGKFSKIVSANGFDVDESQVFVSSSNKKQISQPLKDYLYQEMANTQQ